MVKVIQTSSVKKSKVVGGRPLNPKFRIEDGKIISEQEVIEAEERRQELERAQEERAERLKEWRGLEPMRILLGELEKRKPGTTSDPTFSISQLESGDIDVHLGGRAFRVLEHVVRHSDKTLTWHITAQGVLDRLKSMAVRPDAAQPVRQAELYQEQAEILRELAGVAGLLDDEALKRTLEGLKEVKDEAVRWKTEVNLLFISLRTRIGELRCQISPPPPPHQPKPAARAPKPRGAPQKPKGAARKPRPKADPAPPKIETATPAESAAEVSPTT